MGLPRQTKASQGKPRQAKGHGGASWDEDQPAIQTDFIPRTLFCTPDDADRYTDRQVGSQVGRQAQMHAD